MDLIWYILIYSFLGFLLELFYARMVCCSRRVRKCLFLLPMCPVYGLGAGLILSLPAPILHNVWLLMPCSALAATAVEYLVGWFYETCWHVSFWDYSGLPGSIQGRVCLPFSLIWCLISLPLVLWIHPLVIHVVSLIPSFLLPPAAALFAADFAFTGHLLRQTKSIEVLRWYRKSD